MDIKILFEAAREGNIEVFRRLLQENPSIVADTRLTSPAESILHVATKSGQLDVVNEIMKKDADIAGEMNKDGLQALDVAVIMGNLAIVRNILSYDRDLGRLRGIDNRSALHYAAAKGRVKIIFELLSTCPDCLEDITVYGETALHLAVKNYQFEAFIELVKWVERLSKDAIINNQDGDGNTILHLAVLTKQYACLNLLLPDERGRIQVNVRNGKGLTALDISDIVIQQDCYDPKIRGLLQDAGAERAAEPNITIPAVAVAAAAGETNSLQPIQTNHVESAETGSRNWEEYFKFRMERDPPSETRNSMLVVSALIATVTFQAGINPPSALFDASSTNQSIVFGTDGIFLFFNTLGLCASLQVIIYLTTGFPLYRELYASLFSIMGTYSGALTLAVRAKSNSKNSVRLFTFFLPIVVYYSLFFLRWIPYWGKGARNHYRRRRAATNQDGLPIGNPNN